MKNLFFLLFCGCFITYTSCIKPDNTLPSDPCAEYYKDMPPATQEGAYSFGCYINGEPWVAYTNPLGEFIPGGIKKLRVDYNTQNGYLFIQANRLIEESQCDTIDQTFTIDKWHPQVGNNIDFMDWDNNTIYQNYGEKLFYRLDTLSPYNLHISNLDTVNRIVSGTFEFVAIDDNTLDTIYVTDGRFDKHY